METLTEVRTGQVEVDRIFAAQRTSVLQRPYPPYKERLAHLDSLRRVISQNVDAFCDAIDADYGHRSPRETKLLEIFPTLAAISHAQKNLKAWMKPERKPVSWLYWPGRAEVVKQPLGVVGILSPWNYPLYLAAVPLVSVLAAGNRAIIRMSESTPRTARLFAELIRSHFSEDQVAVIEGDHSIAQALAAKPLDHLVFTGSTSTGREIMQTAAKSLTPVTLELGGKSPAMIAPGFPLAVAAERILWGKCLNAGQTCIAPDYLLVPQENLDPFVKAARNAVQKLYPAGAASPDYTSIINAEQYERLIEVRDDARDHGASIIELTDGTSEVDRKLPPTLVLGVNDDMRIMQSEIFGPLLPVIPYSSLDSALAFIANRPRPLASYYFDYDHARVQRVLHESISGDVTVNDTILHIAQDELPFGGVGASGMGEYHGVAGFHRFSKRKGVFLQSRINGLSLLKPPFGRLFDMILGHLLK